MTAKADPLTSGVITAVRSSPAKITQVASNENPAVFPFLHPEMDFSAWHPAATGYPIKWR